MIIVVGSNARNAGKTSLICAIIRHWPHLQWQALKVTPHHHLHQSGDTARFRQAGAAQAFLRSMDHLPALEGHWIIESNRILEVHTPDAYIFLEAPSPLNEKPPERWRLHQAQVHLQGWAPSEHELPAPVRELISSLLK